MNGDSIILEKAVKASALPQLDPESATAFAGTIGGATRSRTVFGLQVPVDSWKKDTGGF